MPQTHLRLLALAALCWTLAYAEVPAYIKVCGRRNPNLNDCVKDSISFLVPKLGDGIPELNVSSIEPMEFDKIVLGDLPEFKAVATNVKLRGMSKNAFNYVKVDLDQGIIDFEIVFPEVYLESDYDVQAKILVPINEKGPIKMRTENAVAGGVMRFKKVVHRGRTFIYFSTIASKLVIKDFTATFKPGDKNPIAEAINSVLVSSRKEIIESMTPNIEKAIGIKVLETANQVCKHFTYDELFPDTA